MTNTGTDWKIVSSDIIPNFGDYTDNYVIATSGQAFTGDATTEETAGRR